jgi:hypothetical protein
LRVNRRSASRWIWFPAQPGDPFPLLQNNFEEIKKCLQDKLTDRTLDHLNHEHREPSYRCLLADSSDLYFQERYDEALTRRLECINDLKKLVFIAARMKELDIEFAPLARARKNSSKSTPLPPLLSRLPL